METVLQFNEMKIILYSLYMTKSYIKSKIINDLMIYNYININYVYIFNSTTRVM